MQLHQGNRLPETRVLAVAEMRVDGVCHVSQSILLSEEPPLWPKDVGIRAPDCFRSSDSVEALADLGASGDEIAVEVVAFGGYSLESETAHRRPHAKALADYGLEVGQGLGLCPGDGMADGRGGAADFVDEGAVCWGRGDERQESHAKGVGGGVGARDAAGCLAAVFKETPTGRW